MESQKTNSSEIAGLPWGYLLKQLEGRAWPVQMNEIKMLAKKRGIPEKEIRREILSFIERAKNSWEFPRNIDGLLLQVKAAFNWILRSILEENRVWNGDYTLKVNSDWRPMWTVKENKYQAEVVDRIVDEQLRMRNNAIAIAISQSYQWRVNNMMSEKKKAS